VQFLIHRKHLSKRNSPEQWILKLLSESSNVIGVLIVVKALRKASPMTCVRRSLSTQPLQRDNRRTALTIPLLRSPGLISRLLGTMSENEYLVPFLGALQASIAVLLTISVGVIAAQFRLLTESASKEISQVGINIFLPALLITNIGSQISLDTSLRYVPIIIWALVYGLLSVLLGMAITRIFRTPSWVTPAIAFNNTTSLPLLLVQSLAATRLLDTLDESGTAVARAKSYFLVNAMVGNCLTFALGMTLLKSMIYTRG
jgi:hypothetical protein